MADDVIREYAHTGMSGREAVEKVALVAARTALEEAEKAMNSGDVVDWVEAGNVIRAMCDGLEP